MDMKLKVTPIWEMQTKYQIGTSIGFTLTQFNYMASGPFWVLDLDILVGRISITY